MLSPSTLSPVLMTHSAAVANIHDYGVADPRGRRVGAVVYIDTINYVAVDATQSNWRHAPGIYFRARYQNTRNGEHWQASTTFESVSEFERDQWIEGIVSQGRKRAAAKFGLKAAS